MGDDPFNRSARNAVRMIADYPNLYPDRTAETEGAMENEAGTYLIETITDLTAVHVFNDRIVVVDAEGEVLTYQLAD